ncbi:MAG: DUF4054 domain-containing protein [Steroidobacteraceae bacterium]
MITPGIVTFDPAAFIAAYPSFATVPASALQANFNSATLMLNNSWCSVVRDEPTRAQLLNLLTAHITALLNGAYGEGPSGAVGRVSSATEGSVSANIDYLTQSEAAAYFTQTQWGAMFWQATAIYRTARYVSACHRNNSWEAWPE